MPVVVGQRSYFPHVDAIDFLGPKSDCPLAYRFYDANRVVGNKTLKDHLRFAVSYWHSFGGTGGDPFGLPTKAFPWLEKTDPLEQARDKMDAAFELMSKLGVPYYCFHDFDLVQEGSSLAESEKRLAAIGAYAQEKQAQSGIALLWGTANLFSHRRYMNGAATNPDFQVVAYAGAQVKQAIDLTILLKGENYLFWGGREGYLSLLNTDMQRERDHMARFLHLAKDYARSQGFAGNFFLEPKPMEPSKHQYDFDAATTLGFLREYDLLDDFKLNIEVNHATLAGHSFAHELQVAADAGALGSIDANRGDAQNGWDTDQFPINLYELVEAMLVLLDTDALSRLAGGINFDAKTRRNSTDLDDILIAHIAGMDVFAQALIVADRLLNESPYRSWRTERYASFDQGDGQRFARGQLTLELLHALATQNNEPSQISGHQEMYEALINQHL